MRTEALTTTDNVQYAALPWRGTASGIEFLLITTLNTRRWIVPKGWPLDGLTPHGTAAREALEEAGICGAVEADALGSFSYDKVRKSGENVSCTVIVFPMRVEVQRKRWNEKGARDIQWCSIEQALERVDIPGLRLIISQFARSYS